MSANGHDEQEREAKELIRRAERTPTPTSTLRKDALMRLIELAHSPHPPLKKLAANNITKFFKDFPEHDEVAINAVYDLCEDQDPQIRIDGYKAIVQMSKEQPKWVKRNADVLVQLLQSDEPDEVVVVKKALSAHLDMDPKVTLGVLCDQIVPPDEPMDEEDKAIRERLRSLVVAYMAGEARQAIVGRHASQRGSDQERILINGLFKAVSKFGRTDATKIIKDILVLLPSFKGGITARGNELLQIVVEQAKSSVKEDLSKGGGSVTLELARYFLELAGFLSLEKGVSDPAHLLRFYCTSGLLGKLNLQRFSRDAQMFVIIRTAETISACTAGSGKAPDRGDLAAMRRQVVDASVILLPLFVKAKPSDAREWNACEILLNTCQQRKDTESWNIPSVMLAFLEDIHRLAGEQQGLKLNKVQDLSRSLARPAVQPLPPKPPPAVESSKPSPVERTSSTVIKRKAEDQAGPAASRPRAESISIRGQHAREQPPHIAMNRRMSQPSLATSAPLSAAELSLSHSMKRLKTSSDAQDLKPSLLSRMAQSNGGGIAPRPGVVLPRPASTQPARNEARLEISIKGAARAQANGRSSDSPSPRPTSLLDRMQDDGEGGRKKKWKKKA